MFRECFSYDHTKGDIGMDVDLLNYHIWRTANHLILHHDYFLVNNDEGILTLRKSEGFVTTFIWLIPGDPLNPRRIERELEDSLTWMSAYRRKTPSIVFRSIHLYLYTTKQDPSYLQSIAHLGTNSLAGGFQASAWAIDLRENKLYTPTLWFTGMRRIRTILQNLLSNNSMDTTERMNGQNLTQLIQIWQQEMLEKQRKSEQLFQRRIRFRTAAPFTIAIAGVTLIVWLLMTIYGGSTNPDTLIRFGAKDNLRILNGEYWRLITTMFLHIGGMHLWFNSTALLSIGGHVERIYGSARFLFIYLFSGISGTLASFLFSSAISAGASGAIFGLFGALLYFSKRNANVFGHTMGPGLITALLVNLLLGFIIPGIDNYAHIGGLIGGYLAASLMRLPKLRKSI